MHRILIIEDEATFRGVVAAALTNHGFTVMEAADGRAGVALLKDNPIDVILTDVLMPDSDGMDVIMAVRKMKSNVPVIAMTGHPALTEVYLRVAKSLGANRVLEKPFTTEKLLGVIREVLPHE